MLPPEAIREFNDLYERVYGERLSDAEAWRLATRWLRLFSTIVTHVASAPAGNVKNHDLQPVSQ